MSVPYFGDFKEDDTVYIPFNTFTSDDPSASVTITNLADTDIHIHKDGNTTQHSASGTVDVAIDFDGITGNHLVTIDLSADAFFAVGSDYQVRMEGTTVDGATINAWIGSFSIENRFNEVDVVKWLGEACKAVSVSGVPEVDITHIGGDAQSATDLKDFADAGYDPASNKVQGVVLVDTVTTNSDMRGTDNAALASVCSEGRLAELDSSNLIADVATVDGNVDTLLARASETRLAELDSSNLVNDVAVVDANVDTLLARASEVRLSELDASNLIADVAAVPAATKTAMEAGDGDLDRIMVAVVNKKIYLEASGSVELFTDAGVSKGTVHNAVKTDGTYTTHLRHAI